MSAALTEQLIEIARAAEAAGHGAKTRIYVEAAARLGMSVPTLLKKLKSVTTMKPRKRRADAGKFALTRDEAMLIASTVEHTRRETGTGEARLEDVIEVLRDAGKISAGNVNERTGEWTPLSLSAIRRALAHYGVHPDQLAQPTPASRLSSPHPNHCWQIDASVSRQFYLADDGAKVMDKRTFYRGKPQNFVAINDRRLWRYVVTDHCTGALEVFYVLGAETAANLLASLIHTMTKRAESTMYGVPRILMTDPGSAMTAATTAAFVQALGIELIINKVGNARAKGQVENAQYIVETHFEAPLKLRAPVSSLEEINGLASTWARAFNATRIHSRTGMTRRDGWLRITPEELRLAPSVDVLRALPTSKPVTCTVRDYRIKFRSREWDVTALPGVLNGGKVEAVINPFDDANSVRVLTIGDDGRQSYFIAPLITTTAWGFDARAAEIGSEFKAQPDTPTDAARKELDRLTMQVETDAEAATARKAKRLAFNGELDPAKRWREADVPPALPRAATPSDVDAVAITAPRPDVPSIQPRYDAPLLDHTAMAMALRKRVEARGGQWTAAIYARMAERWPDGVTEDRLDDCVVQLLRGGLRVAGGAA